MTTEWRKCYEICVSVCVIGYPTLDNVCKRLKEKGAVKAERERESAGKSESVMAFGPKVI